MSRRSGFSRTAIGALAALVTTVAHASASAQCEGWLVVSDALIIGKVVAMTEYEENLVIAGGLKFFDYGHIPSVAVWDGSSWHALENGSHPGLVTSLTVMPSKGHLFVGGNGCVWR